MGELVPHIVRRIHLKFALEVIDDYHYPGAKMKVDKWRIVSQVERVPFLLRGKKPGRNVIPQTGVFQSFFHFCQSLLDLSG
jgi:hypothetical protein